MIHESSVNTLDTHHNDPTVILVTYWRALWSSSSTRSSGTSMALENMIISIADQNISEQQDWTCMHKCTVQCIYNINIVLRLSMMLTIKIWALKYNLIMK